MVEAVTRTHPERYGGQVEEQDVAATVEEHRTTTSERGPFCVASCTCGWRGPARRARSLARTDARNHTPE
ncbi:hypothetical protein GCM10010280_58900 [Streptomyces pilosus]|uniref:Uncharacterized protein n=1 Tax=Streptomyces pilosus TaxID=28893 RepID=A0A918C3C6_9ACTN|nr:hypothetical protein GCM10010280_58900 [Streptomyces pilosus]